MLYEVMLTKRHHQYLARVRELPELVVTGTSRDQAIEQIRAKLIEYSTSPVEVVKIEVPLLSLSSPSNYWLENFGCCREDPTFDHWQVEIDNYRRKRDAETLP